jgi:hypothetical protein
VNGQIARIGRPAGQACAAAPRDSAGAANAGADNLRRRRRVNMLSPRRLFQESQHRCCHKATIACDRDAGVNSSPNRLD